MGVINGAPGLFRGIINGAHALTHGVNKYNTWPYSWSQPIKPLVSHDLNDRASGLIHAVINIVPGQTQCQSIKHLASPTVSMIEKLVSFIL